MAAFAKSWRTGKPERAWARIVVPRPDLAAGRAVADGDDLREGNDDRTPVQLDLPARTRMLPLRKLANAIPIFCVDAFCTSSVSRTYEGMMLPRKE